MASETLRELLDPSDCSSTCNGTNEEDLRHTLEDEFALAIGERFTASACPEALLQANGKDILVEGDHALLAGTKKIPSDVAAALDPSEICDDLLTFFKRLDAASTTAVVRALGVSPQVRAASE